MGLSSFFPFGTPPSVNLDNLYSLEISFRCVHDYNVKNSVHGPECLQLLEKVTCPSDISLLLFPHLSLKTHTYRHVKQTYLHPCLGIYYVFLLCPHPSFLKILEQRRG